MQMSARTYKGSTGRPLMKWIDDIKEQDAEVGTKKQNTGRNRGNERRIRQLGNVRMLTSRIEWKRSVQRRRKTATRDASDNTRWKYVHAFKTLLHHLYHIIIIALICLFKLPKLLNDYAQPLPFQNTVSPLNAN